MHPIKLTSEAKLELERLFHDEPDVADVVDSILDDLELAPHKVRGQHFRPNATLSTRPVHGRGVDAWVIWEWNRVEQHLTVHRLGRTA